MSGYKTPVDRECRMCAGTFATKWPRQFYCDGCKEKRIAENVRKGENARARGKSAAIQSIRAKSDGSTTPLHGLFERPVYDWVTYFTVDYTRQASKNARFNYSRLAAGPSVTKSVKAYQQYVALATKTAVKSLPLIQNKVWISLFVQKPDNKSDAINVVDTVCDGIRDGLGLDDRWFCLDQVNWSIAKTNPNITIRIGQEAGENVIICTHCGELKGLDNFGNRTGLPFGKARVCRECKREVDAWAKVARASA